MRLTVTQDDVIASLRRRLVKEYGGVPAQVAQVDFVDVQEDPGHTMAYIYLADDECVPVLFTTPAFFDPVEAETALMRGDVGAVRVH